MYPVVGGLGTEGSRNLSSVLVSDDWSPCFPDTKIKYIKDLPYQSIDNSLKMVSLHAYIWDTHVQNQKKFETFVRHNCNVHPSADRYPQWHVWWCSVCGCGNAAQCCPPPSTGHQETEDGWKTGPALGRHSEMQIRVFEIHVNQEHMAYTDQYACFLLE